MTIRATKFTPQVLLSAPRRSAAIPNSSGTLALYTVSRYDFESHSKTYAIKVMDISTGHSTQLFDNPNYSEPVWISKDHFIFINEANDPHAVSYIMAADATKPGSKPQLVHGFKCSIANLKAKEIGDGDIALALTAPSNADGTMLDTIKAEKPRSTARVYSKLFVRHWDAYVEKAKSAVFFGVLKTDHRNHTFSVGKEATGGFTNALAGTRLECPVPNFGGAGDFDIGRYGIVFLSKDPWLNDAMWTKTDMYYVPLKTYTETEPPSPILVNTGELQGYTGSLTFSHCGRKVAFTRMRHRQYESDKTRLMLIPDIKDLSNVQEFYRTDDGEGGWDSSPGSIAWSNDDTELFVTAEQKGRQKLFKLPSTPLEVTELPQALTQDGSIGSFSLLSNKGDRLLLTSSSLVDNSSYSLLDPESRDTTLISSSSKEGKTFGLSKKQFEEFWYQGDGDYQCHALVMKPSNFDSAKKYPLAMLIHGGPQGAWTDSWSTRWNPAIFAEQGYIVVMPNPTGSTGYGQAFTDAIALNWGGRPYNDVSLCFDHVANNLPYVNTKNCVALGASYGGYLTNWIQGHPLGRKFKALVCHDGIFNTLADWSTEELFFVIHEMGGTPWEQRELYEKWDPSAFVGEWKTPQLVIHSELDYRLPISEGLAAFNALQTQGVPSRFLMFPDENHWVLKPENSLVWHKEVLGWINKYTGLDTTGLASDVEDLSVR
ncbi:prolyl oligopeptidase [Xylariaceae sp. FL0255]|nr:prolyl oligopeptidase [Xylariaceae sp. FL0255]